MSLDIVLLDANGSPEQQVSVGVDDHHRLIQLLNGGSKLLARLRDYYSDAEFGCNELEALGKEVTKVRARCKDDEPLNSLLKSFLLLIEKARSLQKPLVVLAD